MRKLISILKISVGALVASSSLMLAMPAEALDYCQQPAIFLKEATQAICDRLKPEKVAPPSSACDNELKKCQDVIGSFLQPTLEAASQQPGEGFLDMGGGTFRILNPEVCDQVLNKEFLIQHKFIDSDAIPPEQSFEGAFQGIKIRINSACGEPVSPEQGKETKLDLRPGAGAPAEGEKATSCSLRK